MASLQSGSASLPPRRTRRKGVAFSAVFPFLFLVAVTILVLLPRASTAKEVWRPPPGTDPTQLEVTNQTMTFLIVGVGSGAIGNMVKQWGFAYTAAKYYDISSRLTYFRSGFSYENDNFYLTSRGVDFMTNERYQNSSLRKAWPTLVQYPFVVQPIVLTYNISNFTTYVSIRENDSLILDVEALADIYMGYITTWDHPRIKELNPILGAFLTNQTIIPFGLYGPETGITYALTSAFYRYSARFRKHFKGPFYYWPSNHPHVNPHLRLYEVAFAPFSIVRDTPGGLGYMSYSVYDVASGGRYPFVLFQHHGELQFPWEDYTMPFYKDARVDEHGILRNINYNVSGWPLSVVTYLAFAENEIGLPECDKDKLMLRFFRWIYSYEAPRLQGSYSGFYMVQGEVLKTVLSRLERLACYGHDEPILKQEIIDDHDQAYFPALLALSMVLAGLLLLMGILVVFILRDKKGKRPVGIVRIYNALLLLGALLGYLSIIWFYLVPDSDWICQLRVWFLGVGFTLFLGAMFTRTLQIHRLFRFQASKTMPSMRSKQATFRRAVMDFVFGMVPTFIAQIVILAVWTAKDKLKAELSVVSDVERTAVWVCKADDVWLWIGIEIGFFVCLLVYGIWVVYRTWSVRDKFPESKWLLMAVYNLLLCMTALVPIFATIEIKDDNLFIMVVAGVTFSLSSTLFLIYMPKLGGIIEGLILRFRSSSDRGSSSTMQASMSKTTGHSLSDTNSGAKLDSS